MKRSLFSLVAALALLASLAVPVAAHRQIVTPPGQDGAIIDGPIARPWIEAHCQAAAPDVTEDASDGVVRFVFVGTPDCGPQTNPGGQTTGP